MTGEIKFQEIKNSGKEQTGSGNQPVGERLKPLKKRGFSGNFRYRRSEFSGISLMEILEIFFPDSGLKS